jgi:hypothetical protein
MDHHLDIIHRSMCTHIFYPKILTQHLQTFTRQYWQKPISKISCTNNTVIPNVPKLLLSMVWKKSHIKCTIIGDQQIISEKIKKPPKADLITGKSTTITLSIPVRRCTISGIWHLDWQEYENDQFSYLHPISPGQFPSVIPWRNLLNRVVSKLHIT